MKTITKTGAFLLLGAAALACSGCVADATAEPDADEEETVAATEEEILVGRGGGVAVRGGAVGYRGGYAAGYSTGYAYRGGYSAGYGYSRVGGGYMW
jgi:hypothetical protein